jgi:hypothetical protein
MSRQRHLGGLYALPTGSRPYNPIARWPRRRLLADLRQVENELAALAKVVELDLFSPMMRPIGVLARQEAEKLLRKRRRTLRRALGIH